MAKRAPRTEIFSQGEEVVSGQTVDSNAAWLATRLGETGLPVMRHTTVGDNLEDLVGLLREIAARADCCICTGGLGPTGDDLTAEAVALAFDRPLQHDEQALVAIQQHYQRRGRLMPAINRKQALFPRGSTRLDNDWGTAPGFTVEQDGCRFWFLPGVPYEMRQMFDCHILPQLPVLYDCRPVRRVTLRIIGMGESQLQELVNEIPLPDEVMLSFRAGPLEVQLKLLFPCGYPEERIRQLTEALRAAIGDSVYGIDGLDSQPAGDLLAVLDRQLRSAGHSLALADTVTDGELTRRCAGHDWLQDSRIMPSVQRLCCNLGVAPADAAANAQTLARALRNSAETDYALVLLYEASRAAFEEEKQPAVVTLGLAGPEGCYHISLRLNGRGSRKRVMAATYSLDFLRRCLLGQAMDMIY